MTEDCAQRTDEWFAARLGKVTASNVHHIIARTRSGASASRANYLAQLVGERLTGRPATTYVSDAMAHGIALEDTARAAYEFCTNNTVRLVGFITHPTITMAGASPDGLIDDDGLVEIKCPMLPAHIAALRGAQPPARYLSQVQWQMACTGRTWCDLVNYNTDMPAGMQLHITRIWRDDATIRMLEDEVSAFLREVEDAVKKSSAHTERTANDR